MYSAGLKNALFNFSITWEKIIRCYFYKIRAKKRINLQFEFMIRVFFIFEVIMGSVEISTVWPRTNRETNGIKRRIHREACVSNGPVALRPLSLHLISQS